ncbi:MAG: ankyrin repeat domain-containing protein [Alphaproteobacteria bacterium]|nr:ankyrin repeat domain-containing protein [Alphaproteobacteria bacterium]
MATLGGAAAAGPEDLVGAIRVGDADRVEALLSAGADPNEPLSDEGLPPLFEAIKMGNRGIAGTLLEAGANAEFIYRNDRGEIHSAYSYAMLYVDNLMFAMLVDHGRKSLGDGFMRKMRRLVCTPEICGNVLTVAAVSGRVWPQNILHIQPAEEEAYQDLLRLEGIRPDDPDIGGKPLLPPLHAAAVENRAAIVGSLLRSGAELDLRDNSGMTATDLARANDLSAMVRQLEHEQQTGVFIAAIESGDAKQVKQLLGTGADPNEGSTASRVPLAVAATAGHAAVVDALLAHGAKIDSKDRYHRTPIIFAIAAGNVDIVRLLLARGAEMNGVTMYEATKSGNVGIVRAFLEAGADPTVPYYGEGPQPMHTALQNGHVEIFRLLEEAGVDIHAEWISEAEGNYTTLSDAIGAGLTGLALELIEKGADTDKLICPGEAPCRSYLDIAAGHGNVPLMRRLIAAGNKVRRSKSGVMASDGMVGLSPLMRAARDGNPEAVSILLEHGADISLRNNFDCSALDYAILNNREEAAAVLRKAGATTDQTTCQSMFFK